MIIRSCKFKPAPQCEMGTCPGGGGGGEREGGITGVPEKGNRLPTRRLLQASSAALLTLAK